MRMTGQMQIQVDMYAGGAVMAAVGHYADTANSVAFLSKYNVTNSEALYGLDIIGAALFRKKMRGHTAGIVDASVAYSAGALVDRFLKGRFSGSSTPSTGSGSNTGWEVSDPSLGENWGSVPEIPGSNWGSVPEIPAGYSSGSVGSAAYGEESPSGFGID